MKRIKDLPSKEQQCIMDLIIHRAFYLLLVKVEKPVTTALMEELSDKDMFIDICTFHDMNIEWWEHYDGTVCKLAETLTSFLVPLYQDAAIIVTDEAAKEREIFEKVRKFMLIDCEKQQSTREHLEQKQELVKWRKEIEEAGCIEELINSLSFCLDYNPAEVIYFMLKATIDIQINPNIIHIKV